MHSVYVFKNIVDKHVPLKYKVEHGNLWDIVNNCQKNI